MVKEIPGQTLIGLGVMGAAITLFANLRAPLEMSDWAWWIVQSLQEGGAALWDRLGASVGAEVPSLLVPPLNIGAFLLMTAVGVGIRDRSRHGPVMIDFPLLHLIGGGAVLGATGYIIVAGPVQSGGEPPTDASLSIFLAAAAASFSTPLAGRGNLIKRLWLIVAGVVTLLVANEITRSAGS